MQIVQQNRSFEIAARKNDSPELARVLRAFEPVLLELATADLAAESVAELQTQLSFEINVLLTKMGRAQSDGQETI